MLWLMLLFLNAGPAQDAEEKVEEPKTNKFKETELKWRSEHEAAMKDEDSWLNLVGLFFLKEGANPFGSSMDIRISLPLHSTVEKAGVFFLEDGKVRYEMGKAQRALLDGKLAPSGILSEGKVLAHNHLRMFIIERGGRIALRVRDLRARDYVVFDSLNFYRPKPKYVVEGTFKPFDPPKEITVTTVISTEITLLTPGVIQFEYNGQQLELLPTLESMEDKQYLVMFQDQTSGKTTYSGGRFLYIDPPDENGKVILNFNRAVNPPCAYTVYATCPLPPSENWLDVALEAGERSYQEHQE